MMYIYVNESMIAVYFELYNVINDNIHLTRKAEQ